MGCRPPGAPQGTERGAGPGASSADVRSHDLCLEGSRLQEEREVWACRTPVSFLPTWSLQEPWVVKTVRLPSL